MPTVLLLGATSDMSVALARKFGEHGFSIQLAARNTEPLIPMQADLQTRYNVTCSIHAFDALNVSSHQHFFDSLPAKPDVTICVFGVMYEEDDAWSNWQLTQRMIDTNYTGAVSILNTAAKYYSTQKKGTIVGISSVAGERGRGSKLIYGSTKAAFSAYLSGLRNKLFAEGVHVISVKPGFVYTKMTENLPLPKPLTAQPQEVAKSIYNAVIKKKNVVYVKWIWRYLMLIIKNIPEFIYKKMKM